MFIEARSIPYEATPLRGERLLVLAPHPDDEAIGCGGLVAQHLAEGRKVRILVATNGAAAGDAAGREEESRRGLAHLGEGAEIEFLGFPDRGLDAGAVPRIVEALRSFRPDLVLAPSPLEIHPDHRALAEILCLAVQGDQMLFGDLAVARVAFYEVGIPIRPNVLVDITAVADRKWSAIAEHASQLAVRDYTSYARGLNAYRTMTLPEGVAFAEAYHLVELSELRTLAISQVTERVGPTQVIEPAGETLPLTVIIRTKDRPRLLREAIDSVRATGYPCSIVVVNDGGEDPGVERDDVVMVRHETSRGRSEAGNAGVAAATTDYIAFLDDDDLFYREHLQVLTRAASETPRAAWYSDAISAFLRPGPSGGYEAHSRLRLFAQDFDRQLLLADNYIPLPTLLMRRSDFLETGGFDPTFDLFEDWDLLIRLSQRGDFLRVPQVTCEIRHFEGGSSILLASPEGSDRFREAKLRIWKKHGSLVTPDVMASVFEKQKRRINELYSRTVELSGQEDYRQRDAARMEREAVDLRNSVNGYLLRTRELEGSVNALQTVAADYARKAEQAAALEQELAHAREQSREHVAALEEAQRTTHAALEQARAEIARLGGLLEMIYRSRTWKIHTLAEKLRGRG